MKGKLDNFAKFAKYSHLLSNKSNAGETPIRTLDKLFRQITTFIKVHVAIVFGLQILKLIDFKSDD